MFYFNSVKDRDKYYKKDGTCTEPGKKAYANLSDTLYDLSTFGSFTTKYTD